MKYTSLNKTDIKIKHIEAPSTGIITNKRICSIGEACLKFAKNMIYTEGLLTTRKGLYTKDDGFFDLSMVNGAESYKYSLTDFEVNIDSELYKIARADVKYDSSIYFVFVFGIDKNQSIKTLGYMLFNRVDDSTFYCPENIVFYSGKSENGGIFAMVTLKNTENTNETDYAFLEADSSYSSWNYVSGYYIPTVYINGRGNAYDTLDWGYDSKPQSPESLNLLTGAFYAYYSSDSASYSFRLPFTDIDNSPIMCRIYSGIDNYTEWIVYEDESSAQKTFLDKEVTLNVDRKKGVFYFTSDNGFSPIPIIGAYNENNIKIMAQKEIENGQSLVLSSKCAVKSGDKTLFSGGDSGNKIYYADYETPLYFPQIADNEIGMPSEAITEIKAIDNRIIAFKPYEAYEISVKNGGYFNTASLLADNGAFFKNTDTFSIKKLSGGKGCDSGKAAVVESNIMWLGDDGNIYLLKSNSSKPEKIELKSKSVLDSFDSKNDIYIAGFGENCILCSGYRAIIISTEGNCYYWEFPEEVKIEGIAEIGSNITFVYRYNDSEYCFIAGFDGEQDIYFCENGDEKVLKTLPIKSEFTLNCSHLGTLSAKKIIKSVDFNLETIKDCKITVGDGKVYATALVEQSKTLDDVVKFITDIVGINGLEVNVSSDSSVTFGGADIYYTV